MSKHTIVVPTHLNEIPLEKFIQWEMGEYKDDNEKVLEALMIFCDIPYSHLSKIPFKAISKAIDALSKITLSEPSLEQTFVLNGVKYGFIPNLDNLTTGEFIDLESYLQNERDMWKVMSVLFRRVVKEGQGDKYEIEAYKGEVNEDFKFMPTGIALGARVFFWNIGKELRAYILRSLEVERKSKLLRLIRSIKNGVGWHSSIYSQTEELLKWIGFSNYQYKPILCGRLTSRTYRSWKDMKLQNLENDK